MTMRPSGIRSRRRREAQMKHVFRILIGLSLIAPSFAAPPFLSQTELDKAPVILEGKIKNVTVVEVGRDKCVGKYEIAVTMGGKSKNADDVLYGYLKKF